MPIVLKSDQTCPMPDPAGALSMYAPLVEHNDQAIPVLVVGCTNGMITIPLSEFSPNVADGVEAVITLARLHGYHPVWALVSSEAWYREFSTNEPGWEKVADSIGKGDLERAAGLGDARVTEIVSIWARHTDGSGYVAKVPFIRTVEGVCWGELETLQLGGKSPQVGGAMIEALVHALSHVAVSFDD